MSLQVPNNTAPTTIRWQLPDQRAAQRAVDTARLLIVILWQVQPHG